MNGTEINPKLGYYTVGDNIHYNKIQALIDGTKTNQFPIWNFNNDIFGKQSWEQEPETDLRSLYRMRAQQLRDKYDYIRVESSGGGDSTQVIFNFLLNGIHLDEIIFRYPKTGSESIPITANDYRVENTLAESEFAAKPLLNWVSTNYPNVKITIHDYSADMLNNEDQDESWVNSSREFLQPGHATKFPNYQTIEQLRTANTGKSICVLYGIDKPKMCIRDGEWYLYFMDFQANYANPDVGEYDNITNEYFYWTPDFPEICLKQAHIIRNWFNMPENRHLQFLTRWPNHSVSQRTAYESLIKPLIYFDYDPLTFQVSKPGNNFYSGMDYWFYKNYKDHKLYHVWQAGISFVEKNIDPKFFNKEFDKAVGFVGFLSPFYKIGPALTESSSRTKFDIVINDRVWNK